ncbi:envelope integrity protein Cei [Actinomycetospora cinnamomea]|uniref:LytR cell envelope-related transcriptional attenuator n=1 Tax=Actinomycetospora cinnamomea TaxID=663609 RepID=A0A2U1FPZ3_9PSEU|nr:envelope integrity protein Cei [Actinomycetospora cinnamomea]PVZ14265.1 LytR cell envelope-related transcriptional attenuator [Actinomycetospora cinnamomea]
MVGTSSGTVRAATSWVREAYRRRNLVPATVLVAVLAVASIVTWTIVFTNSTAGSVTSCNPSPVAGAGTPQSADALDDTSAAAPGDVRVHVLNGAGQRGQAQLAAAELGELGIAEAAPPDNDPFYPAQDLSCVGQIRYGPEGASAARTLSLVVPCAELVADQRSGSEVDLALGDDFRDIAPGQEVTDALRALARQTATDGSGAPDAVPDAATLTQLRSVDCST